MKTIIKPDILEDDIALYGDIVYGNYFNDWMQENIPLKLCLLRPFKDPFDWEPLPLFLWVGGGAYRNSTPLFYIPKLMNFARNGYVVASIQYRVTSEALFPAQLQDVKQAIRFLRSHAKSYGIQPDKIAIGGDSAGGHLVTLAALTQADPSFSNQTCSDQDNCIKAVINWYGAGDMEPELLKGMAPHERDLPFILLLGGQPEERPDLAKMASPSYHIHPDAPPFLIFHGREDQTVPIDRSEVLYEKLTRAGVPVDFYILDGAGHGTLEFAQPQISKIMLDFLDRHLAD